MTLLQRTSLFAITDLCYDRYVRVIIEVSYDFTAIVQFVWKHVEWTADKEASTNMHDCGSNDCRRPA